MSENTLENNYQYSRNAGYDKTIKLKEYARLRCFSKKALKKSTMGSYQIVGAVGEGLTKPEGQYLYGVEERFYYSPKQSAMGHKTVGYIQVGDGKYFAVVKKSKRLIFILFVIMLLALTLAGSLFMEKMNGLIDQAAMDFTPPEGLDVDGSGSSIGIPGYSKVYVEAGTDIANVTLWNPKSNPCYFRYTLITEDGEVLYESGLIPPGKAVSEIKLSKRIPEGEQNITMNIDTFSLEDHETPMNGGSIACVLVGYAK